MSSSSEVIKEPVCYSCFYFLGHKHCMAFDEIPDEIWSGENLHDKPVEGDNGYQFITTKDWLKELEEEDD